MSHKDDSIDGSMKDDIKDFIDSNNDNKESLIP